MSDNPYNIEWEANDWYLQGDSGATFNERWVRHSAAIAARSTGKTQVVHKHPQHVHDVRITGLHQETCGLCDCYTVT